MSRTIPPARYSSPLLKILIPVSSSSSTVWVNRMTDDFGNVLDVLSRSLFSDLNPGPRHTV